LARWNQIGSNEVIEQASRRRRAVIKLQGEKVVTQFEILAP
jgi:hypothetical protein